MHQSLPPMATRVESESMGGGSVRPGSMADRARHAKVPQPEQALKCPRCDSTNTKFCYFNNYSLTQPRHFCKTCRRYWTRGGALRNVPVGGGFRRNKRSKTNTGSNKVASTSSSAIHINNTHIKPSSNSSMSMGIATISSTVITPAPLQLPIFMDYGATNIGLNNNHYGGMLPTINNHHQHAQAVVDHYQTPSSGSIMNGMDQWRLQQLQQFPFFAGLDQQTNTSSHPALGMYSFDMEGTAPTAAYGGQQTNVKAEAESQNRLSISRQYLGMNPGNDQYWGNGTGGTATGNLL